MFTRPSCLSTLMSFVRALTNRCSPARGVTLPVPTVRTFSRINILDEKERSDENLFFSKNDEALLKKIFEEQQGQGALGEEGLFKESGTVEEKIKIVFMKNGIPPSANPQLVADLVKLFE